MQNKIISLLWVFVIIIIFTTSCTNKPRHSPQNKLVQTAQTDWRGKYPESTYLTAVASETTEMAAKKSALAALANIFDSHVISYTGNRVESHQAKGTDKDESITRTSTRDIKVLSSVHLTGAKIGTTWFDSKKQLYYAVAILNRENARNNWENKLQHINNKSVATLNALSSHKSHFSKLQTLKNIKKEWLDYQVIVSHLSVIGTKYPRQSYHQIKQILQKQALLRAEILLYIEIPDSQESQFAGSGIAKYLGDNGYVLTKNKQEANVIIEGSVTVSPVSLNNDNFKFARANANFIIIDTESNLIVGKLTEKKRVGHLNYSEASHNAVKKVSKTISKQLLTYFED